MQLAYENSNFGCQRIVTHCDVFMIFGIYTVLAGIHSMEPFKYLPLQPSIKREKTKLNIQCRGIIAGLVLLVGASLPALADNPFRDLVTMSGDEVTGLPQSDDGKWTLVMFWATDCHACEAQKPDISAFNDKHSDGKISVVGISLDGRRNLAKIRAHDEASNASFDSYVGELLLVTSNVELITGEPFRGTPTYLMFGPNNEVKAYNPGMLNMGDLDAYVARNVYGE